MSNGKFSNLMKFCKVTLAGKDGKSFTDAQVSYKGKSKDAIILFPYGLFGNPPEKSTGVAFNIGGQESNLAAIVNFMQGRFKNLAKGEVAVGNPVTGSVVIFKKDGNIEITCTKDQIINVTGDCKINVTGDTTITCPNVKIEGELKVTGEITAHADTPQELSIGGIRTVYNIHTHSENNTGDTDEPTQPM